MSISAKITPILKDLDHLSSLREQYQTNPNNCRDIIAKADNRLVKECPVVTDKKSTFSNDRHNYESMAIYYWPDSLIPLGPYKVRDGKKNPEYNNYDGAKLFALTYSCNDLCNAYYITHDIKYAEKCVEMINAWFLEEDTKMNPNMDYGQVVPNTKGGGHAGAISEAICFIDIIDDISLLYQLGILESSQNKSLKKWFSEFAIWLKKSRLGQQMSKASDNLGIDYDILLCRIYMYIGNKSAIKKLSKTFTENRLKKHFSRDGSQPLELKRTRAYYYSIYNLQHVIDFCMMCEAMNIHYYTNHYERINAAMSYLVQFIGHKDRFPYKEIGDWEELEKQIKVLQRRIIKLKK